MLNFNQLRAGFSVKKGSVVLSRIALRRLCL